MMEKLIDYIVFLPLLAAIAMMAARAGISTIRNISFLVSSLTFLLTLYLATHFDFSSTRMQFVKYGEWIPSYGISYHTGIDSISLTLLLTVSMLMPILHIYMWRYEAKGYWYNMLLLQTGVSGAIVALDMILFYLFWETMLLPIFIMIGRYGHDMNRFNAMKILLYTILGSMAMLFSILYLGYGYFENYGTWSFAYENLAMLSFDRETSVIPAAGFLLAFAIKIPLIGFHTWMAPAYGSAPTPALVILSAVMAKLGIYGIWRFGYGIFGNTLEFYEPYIAALAIGGMLYYAIEAVTENDLRRVFAYSSGSHLSLIALGLAISNIYSWSGSLYFIATHALSSAGIFLMIGLIYRRSGSVKISQLGGIAQKAPIFAFFFSFFALSIAAVPGTGNFVSELLIVIGAFRHDIVTGFLAALTIIAAILYIFRVLRRTLYAEPSQSVESFAELSRGEILMLLPLLLSLLATGLFPSFFLSLSQSRLESILQSLIGSMGGFQ